MFKEVERPALPIKFFTAKGLLASNLSKNTISKGIFMPCSNVDVAKQILQNPALVNSSIIILVCKGNEP